MSKKNKFSAKNNPITKKELKSLISEALRRRCASEKLSGIKETMIDATAARLTEEAAKRHHNQIPNNLDVLNIVLMAMPSFRVIDQMTTRRQILAAYLVTKGIDKCSIDVDGKEFSDACIKGVEAVDKIVTDHLVLDKVNELESKGIRTFDDFVRHLESNTHELIIGTFSKLFSSSNSFDKKIFMKALKKDESEFSHVSNIYMHIVHQKELEKIRIEKEKEKENSAWKKSLIGLDEVARRLGLPRSRVDLLIIEELIPIALEINIRANVTAKKVDPSIIASMTPEHIEHLRKESERLSRDDDRELVLKEARDQRYMVMRRTNMAKSISLDLSDDGEHILFDFPFHNRHTNLKKIKAFIKWPDIILDQKNGQPLTGKFRRDTISRLQKITQKIITSAESIVAARFEYFSQELSRVKKDMTETEEGFFTQQIISSMEEFSNLVSDNRIDVQNLDHFFQEHFDSIIQDAEKTHLEARKHVEIKIKTGLADYASMFPLARSMNRKLVFHVGPTNSGKTHLALEEFGSAPSGIYLAPLRLMALEIYEKFKERHLPINMITGEERILDGLAEHTSQTIETANTEKEVDIAVIDEVQLLDDNERGWAWTQAIIGVPARKVIMTGSIEALPFLRKIVSMTHEDLEIVQFERMTSLSVMPTPLNIDDLRPGDAVITFSRGEVLALKETLEKKYEVAVLYGALGPEVRKSEAARFRTNEAQILVATDAVGMGLNLPISRIIFARLDKFDGSKRRPLNHCEIRQIAGRAGRYGLFEKGFTGTLSPTKPDLISEALSAAPTIDANQKLFVLPPWRAINTIANEYESDDLAWIIRVIANMLLADDPDLMSADLAKQVYSAMATRNSGLNLKTRYQYLGAPIDFKVGGGKDLEKWSKLHGKQEKVPCITSTITEVPSKHWQLDYCETMVKRLTAWIWMSMRWPSTYVDRNGAMNEKRKLNTLIEASLKKKALIKTKNRY